MRVRRIVGRDIRAPHVKRIQATVLVLKSCTYTAYRCISADNPTVDFESSAAESLASSRLVDSKRDDVFGGRMMEVEGIDVYPGGQSS